MARKKRTPHNVDEIKIQKNIGDFKNNEVKNIFTTRFNQILTLKNIHQDQLARDTNISTGSISDYRNGKSEPKITHLRTLADYIGVSTDYLLGKTKDETPEITIQAIHQKTGLSARAIKRLNFYLNENLTISKTINKLIVDNNEALQNIDKYLELTSRTIFDALYLDADDIWIDKNGNITSDNKIRAYGSEITFYAQDVSDEDSEKHTLHEITLQREDIERLMLERIITNIKKIKYDFNQDYIFVYHFPQTYLIEYEEEDEKWQNDIQNGIRKLENYHKWLESIGAGKYI